MYRAKDTRLGRAAAIKTLPPEFALDDDRRLRFEREARTLATLNHPHIAQIYGLEDLPAVDGAPATFALAMELVEGEDLAQRISRGPVALDEVWPLARQIAEGLEAAHEAGIVHRDLKPANIRVTPDGVVKVLDFGLAKPMEPVGESRLATQPPTLTSPALTTRGVVLGTASYMAPEQAKGKPVDRRADIWAFGCVLYELLTAKRAFDGEDVPDILGAIIKSEPDWTKLPAATPTRVRTLLARCLTKDRTQRLQHIGDARLELTTPGEGTPELVTAQPRASRLGWVVAGIATAAAAILAALVLREEPAAIPRVARFHIPLADDQQFTNVGRHVLALSPDGTRLRLPRHDGARAVQGVPTHAGRRDDSRGLDGYDLSPGVVAARQRGRPRGACRRDLGRQPEVPQDPRGHGAGLQERDEPQPPVAPWTGQHVDVARLRQGFGGVRHSLGDGGNARRIKSAQRRPAGLSDAVAAATGSAPAGGAASPDGARATTSARHAACAARTPC